ncbi:MAG: ROK family protein [bacterium]
MNKIAVDVGGSHIDLALISENFQVNLINSINISYDFAFEEFCKWLVNSLKKEGIGQINRIGFALPGRVDSLTNYCFICPNLKRWKNLDFNIFYEIFKKEGIRVDKIIISNDANAGTVGAYKILGLESKNVVYVAVGTGIGAGAIVNNEILLGANFSAMEVGHTVIEKKTFICGCGSWGCIETFASAKALVKKFNQWYGTNYQDLLSIIENEKENRIKRVFKYFAKYFSILLTNIVYFIDPDFILISGKIVLSNHLFKEYLFKNFLSRLKMINDYDLSRVIFLIEDTNIYNLVGAVYIEDFLSNNY